MRVRITRAGIHINSGPLPVGHEIDLHESAAESLLNMGVVERVPVTVDTPRTLDQGVDLNLAPNRMVEGLPTRSGRKGRQAEK